jgi:phage FluMu protein Com
MRTARDFFARTSDEQRWLTKESWCDFCDKADLGIASPVEFEEGGKIYIEGKCPRCGTKVVTQIVEIEHGKRS